MLPFIFHQDIKIESPQNIADRLNISHIAFPKSISSQSIYVDISIYSPNYVSQQMNSLLLRK